LAYCFPKYNKLCGQLNIAHVYQEGKKQVIWPLRITWLPTDGETKILIWAPKSLFKKAVDRNKIRRLMREAYRLNQRLLGDCHYMIAINYMDKAMPSYAQIERSMRKALTKIATYGMENNRS
jgi:ribonuclease P protein component